MGEIVQFYGYRNESETYDIFPKVYIDCVVNDASAEGEYDGSGIGLIAHELVENTIDENVGDVSFTGPVVFKIDGNGNKIGYVERPDDDANMSYLSGENSYVRFGSDFKIEDGSLLINFSYESMERNPSTGDIEVKDYDLMHGIIDGNPFDGGSSDGKYLIVGRKDGSSNKMQRFELYNASEIIGNGDTTQIKADNLNDASSGVPMYLLCVDETGVSTSAVASVDRSNGKYVYIKNYSIYQTSDDNAKDYMCDLKVSLDDISEIRKAKFSWKDGDGTVQIGVSAQSLMEKFPELVSESDGKLSVSYDKLSVLALSAIDTLYEKVSDLESRISSLEKMIEK